MQHYTFLPKHWPKLMLMAGKGLVKLTFKKVRCKWYHATVDLNHRNDLIHVGSI